MVRDEKNTSDKTPETRHEGGHVAISTSDLGRWGVGLWAYAKPVVVNGQQVIGIFSADGGQIGLAADQVSAWAAIRQNDMEPMGLH